MSNLSLLYEKDFSNWTARTVDLLRQGRFTKRTGVKEDRGQKKDRGQVFPFSFRRTGVKEGPGSGLSFFLPREIGVSGTRRQVPSVAFRLV
jgi:hypothetical protein